MNPNKAHDIVEAIEGIAGEFKTRAKEKQLILAKEGIVNIPILFEVAEIQEILELRKAALVALLTEI